LFSREEFIIEALEVNLFYMRIMKEHLFFIETHLPRAESYYILEASKLKIDFENLLGDTAILANGFIKSRVKNSGELYTKHTLSAEKLTCSLTGSSINTDITIYEMKFKNTPNFDCTPWLEENIHDLNVKAKGLLQEVMDFKKNVLKLKLECKLDIMLYPEMLNHLIEESEVYMLILDKLLNRESIDNNICDTIVFWNHIMMDHADFVNGMLDPSEKILKERAEYFSESYDEILEKCINDNIRIFRESRNITNKFRRFKQSTTEGLLSCEIKSIITPLLADHILREANHYLRLLKNWHCHLH